MNNIRGGWAHTSCFLESRKVACSARSRLILPSPSFDIQPPTSVDLCVRA